MSDLATVMAAVLAVQASIPTPPDQKALNVPLDIQPPPLVTPPMFVNEVRRLHLSEGEYSGRTFGNAARHNEWCIEMHLCFAPFDPKYQIRNQWAWTDAVLDTFDGNAELNAVCDASKVMDVDFAPFDYNGTRFICSTFPLYVTTKKP